MTSVVPGDKKSLLPKAIALATLLGGGGLIFIVSLIASLIVQNEYRVGTLPHEKFNSVVWKQNLDSKKPVKSRMVNDLLAKHSLVGKTKSEIEELLGIPPDTSYFEGCDYVYWLGPERGLYSIDSDWLCIKFKRDIVIEARIRSD